jgi:hypothetical protein
MEHLECHLPFVLEVAREIDRGHPAMSELTLENVAFTEGLGELSPNIGHPDCRRWRPFQSGSGGQP